MKAKQISTSVKISDTQSVSYVFTIISLGMIEIMSSKYNNVTDDEQTIQCSIINSAEQAQSLFETEYLLSDNLRESLVQLAVQQLHASMEFDDIPISTDDVPEELRQLAGTFGRKRETLH